MLPAFTFICYNKKNWRYLLIVNFLEKKFLKYANTHLLKLRNANGEFLDLSILKEKENLTNQLSSLSH